MKIISKPISIVTINNPDGSIKPVRFRLRNENEEEIVIKIETIRTRDKLKIDKRLYSIFNCLIIVNGVQQLCEIRLEHDTCKWFLWKI